MFPSSCLLQIYSFKVKQVARLCISSYTVEKMDTRPSATTQTLHCKHMMPPACLSWTDARLTFPSGMFQHSQSLAPRAVEGGGLAGRNEGVAGKRQQLLQLGPC